MAIPNHMEETVNDFQKLANDNLLTTQIAKLYQTRDQVREACAEGNIDKFNEILNTTGYSPFAWKGFFGASATTPITIFDFLFDRYGFSVEDEQYVLKTCFDAGNMELYDYAKKRFDDEQNQTYSDSDLSESENED